MSYYRNFESYLGMPITQADKEWIEETMKSFLMEYGFRRMKSDSFYSVNDFIEPGDENGMNWKEAQRVCLRVAGVFELNESDVEMVRHEVNNQKEWIQSKMGKGIVQAPVETAENLIFEMVHKPVGCTFFIVTHQRPLDFVLQIARIAAKHRLAEAKFAWYESETMERMADLLLCVVGFGRMLAEANDQLARSGQLISLLPVEHIAYANAVMVKVSGQAWLEEIKNYPQVSREEFRTFYEFLDLEDDTLFFSEANEWIEAYFEAMEPALRAWEDADGAAMKRAALYFLQGDFDFALGQFLLGKAELLLENFDAAIACFNESLEMEPESKLVIACRGLARLNKGDFHSAATDLIYALEMEKGNAWYYFWCGILMLKLERPAMALNLFTQAVSFGIRLDGIYHWMAQACAATGDEVSKLRFEKWSVEMEESDAGRKGL